MTSGKVISEKDIELFIPQRPPFVFIDAIEEVNAELARTRFTVPACCPLVTDNILPLAGLVENAAQTCAARAGFTSGNKIGYIGAIKQVQAYRLPSVGETLTTEARLIQEVLNISLIECTTHVKDEIIATATLKLAVMD